MLGKAERYSPTALCAGFGGFGTYGQQGAEAREVTADALPALCGLGKPVVPRVNSLGDWPYGGRSSGCCWSEYVVAISIGKISGHRADIELVDEIVISDLER